MTAASLGAKRVLATDADNASLERLKQAVSQNGMDFDKVTAHQYLWGDDVGQIPLPAVDTIIAADVTYDTTSLPELVQTLSDSKAIWPGVSIFIAATIRNEDTFAAFDGLIGDCAQTLRHQRNTDNLLRPSWAFNVHFDYRSTSNE